MRTCPTHGSELVEKLLWSQGKKIGRVWYCPADGCGYQVKEAREPSKMRKKGQSAIDGGEAHG